MRVVLDTNVLISALTVPGGRGEEALLRAVEGRDSLVLSKALLDELLGVLARKFSRNKEELSRVAVFLADSGEFVKTRERLKVLQDERDNRVLECAVAGDADLIVTGDRAMLALGEYQGIRIISLATYLGSKRPSS